MVPASKILHRVKTCRHIKFCWFVTAKRHTAAVGGRHFKTTECIVQVCSVKPKAVEVPEEVKKLFMSLTNVDEFVRSGIRVLQIT